MLSRLVSVFKNNLIKRCVLTQSYPCTALWNEKLNNLPHDLAANDLAVQLQAKLSSDQAISPLDFDILMNRTNEIDLRNIEYIIKIIKDFRKTQEAIKVFESSSHGVLRNLIDLDEEFQAFYLIRDREKTGIFLDEITVNLLIDKFLINENWENAFFTSAEWVLQECLEDSKLGISMCFISCLHFWQQSLWKHKPPIVDVSKVPVELVPVRYLKPQYFDDHFDLCNDKYRRRLLGKCLFMLSNHLHLIGPVEEKQELEYYRNNFGLLGLVLHEKLDRLLTYMENWLENENVQLNNELVAIISELINTAEQNTGDAEIFHPTHTEEDILNSLTRFQNLVEKFRAKELLDDQDLLSKAMDFVNNKIVILCDSETKIVSEKYNKFASHRLEAFESEKSQLTKQSILENSKKRLLELTEQEEMIKYFEKMPEIMYKSWLAKRTREEKRYSVTKSNQQNLENIKRKSRPKFQVQHES